MKYPGKVDLTFLGFDFGTKNIGVAVGQTITLTASPLNPLAAKMGIPNWDQIAVLISKWQPAAVVVGIPLNMDSTSQLMTKMAKQFAHDLNRIFSLTVYEVDERLTTVEAKQLLYELGGYKGLKEVSIDCFAAKLILESWMRDFFTN
jgi:putative Holliday junction resolvase